MASFTGANPDPAAQQSVTQVRKIIFRCPRKQDEFQAFYEVVEQLNSYGFQMIKGLQNEVRALKIRHLADYGSNDLPRLLREHWDEIMKYGEPMRAWTILGEEWYEYYSAYTGGGASFSFGYFGAAGVTKGASPATEANAKLWHIADYGVLGAEMKGEKYWNLALAYPTPNEVDPFIMDTGAADFFQKEFNLGEWNDPYIRPANVDGRAAWPIEGAVVGRRTERP
ncbi:MAG: hypothetical protein Q9178_008018 [Gyalolechia marmorata]